MLSMIIAKSEYWDERTEQFINVKEQTIKLEHSLVSISKWESRWHKPFLGKESKTEEEVIDYIRCMNLTQNVEPEVFYCLGDSNLRAVNEYIENPMTATTFSTRHNGKNNSEQTTAELIYYWMIALNIPFECQKWHLNKLLTLIEVCEIKNEPPKKMGKRQLMDRNRELNTARRKKLNTTG